MEIKAKLNHLHIAPRKVRLVSNLIKGTDAKRAETALLHLQKRSSRPILKLLKSAVANAKHDLQIESEKDMFVKAIRVNQGPVLKRFRARAFGRASQILKRTSHVELTLDIKGGVVGKKEKKKEGPIIRDMEEQIQEDFKKPAEEFQEKSAPVQKLSRPGFVRRMFRRKAI